jgi:hypothetical protein
MFDLVILGLCGPLVKLNRWGLAMGLMQMVSCCCGGAVLVFDSGVGKEDFLCLICLICCAGIGIDVEFDSGFGLFGFLTMFIW